MPVLLLYFLLRGLRNSSYWRTLAERFGFLPSVLQQTGPGAIWLHAVSVGEVLACLELARQLRREFPRAPLFVSTSTLAGRAAADDKLRALADGVFYLPVDYCFAVRRVLRRLQPSLVVIAETEIWPNLFREVKRLDARLAIINARLSDRAFPRYRLRRWFFVHPLAHPDAILAQSPTMRDRFIAIGAPPESVIDAGNLKYDFQPTPPDPASEVPRFLDRLAPSGVWIAASTMPPAAPGDIDEDDAVIAAFRELAPRHPRLLLLLAPRKPERFDEVARKLATAGLSFARRTSLPDTLALPGILLLDSIGELAGLFSLASVVFMGGTLAQRGGHNLLEPAFFSQPVIIGPHMENFTDIAAEFRAAEACLPIDSPAALAPAIDRLLGGRDLAQSIGARALSLANARRGATAAIVATLRSLYDRGVPRYRPAWPWFPLAWLLAQVWNWAGRRSMRSKVLRRRALSAKVASIGNLTMGGTGKTPCVLWLARALRDLGRHPAILTRGYGRISPHKHLVVAPGTAVTRDHTGDEPLLFIRSALAPVGIGPDRYQTGRLVEQQFGADVLLLDDGFQHVRLLRHADIVLIDALNPFGGGELVPLGRLREPIAGLSRADLVVITRSSFSELAPAIERVVRRWNVRAPVFRATVKAQAWVSQSGERFPVEHPPFGRAAAFCGLGNPRAFRASLEALGVQPVDWVEYEDHHRYRPVELRRLAYLFIAAGASAVLTTEKDAVNLCDGAEGIFGKLPLYYLEVGMALDREADFLAALAARLG